MEKQINEFNWPNQKKSIFKMEGAGSVSQTWCSLKHIDLWSNAYDIALAFKRAGDSIVSSVEADKNAIPPDSLFMPVAYLYRHSLENILKSIIPSASILGLVGSYDEKILRGHRLDKLWEFVEQALVEQWSEEDRNPLENVAQLVNGFHIIDELGQSLRYSHTIKGDKSSDKYPDAVDLKELKEAFSAVFNLLEGCGSMFSDEAGRIGEAKSNYWNYY